MGLGQGLIILPRLHRWYQAEMTAEQREFSSGRIWLSVNGEMRQDADLSDLT